MTLTKIREAGTNRYTYYWTKDQHTVSPYFETEEQARAWLKTAIQQLVRNDLTYK